jgi:hypothetical protein
MRLIDRSYDIFLELISCLNVVQAIFTYILMQIIYSQNSNNPVLQSSRYYITGFWKKEYNFSDIFIVAIKIRVHCHKIVKWHAWLSGAQDDDTNHRSYKVASIHPVEPAVRGELLTATDASPAANVSCPVSGGGRGLKPGV